MLAVGDGLFSFRTMDDVLAAIDAIDAIETDYLTTAAPRRRSPTSTSQRRAC